MTFGSWNEMSIGFKFLGRVITQDPVTFEIETNMDDYCSELEELIINKSEHEGGLLSAQEISLMRTMIGKNSWAARQGRPDVLFWFLFFSSPR